MYNLGHTATENSPVSVLDLVKGLDDALLHREVYVRIRTRKGDVFLPVTDVYVSDYNNKLNRVVLDTPEARVL